MLILHFPLKIYLQPHHITFSSISQASNYVSIHITTVVVVVSDFLAYHIRSSCSAE